MSTSKANTGVVSPTNETVKTVDPRPTIEAAFALGLEAATDRFGLDCNPWKNEPEADKGQLNWADQRVAWNEGWHSFSKPDLFNTTAWDANCHTCDKQCEFSETDQRCEDCKNATKVHIPEITLKKVEYSMRNSRDSHCFGAAVYLDGKAFCDARDDGWGGETIYETSYNDDSGRRELNFREQQIAVDARIAVIDAALLERDGFKSHGRADGSTFTIPNNCFDYIICELVNTWLVSKDLKKLLRKRFVWQRANGEVRECQRRKEHVVSEMVEVMAKTEPTSKLLNAMPFEDALKIYRAIDWK